MSHYTLLEIWRPRPEWSALPKQQKEKFVARAQELLGEILGKGAKVLGIYKCRAASSDGWDVMGYWEMPSFDLICELAEKLDKMGWNRYFEQVNLVGTATTPQEYLSGLLKESEF